MSIALILVGVFTFFIPNTEFEGIITFQEDGYVTIVGNDGYITEDDFQVTPDGYLILAGQGYEIVITSGSEDLLVIDLIPAFGENTGNIVLVKY